MESPVIRQTYWTNERMVIESVIEDFVMGRVLHLFKVTVLFQESFEYMNIYDILYQLCPIRTIGQVQPAHF